MEVLTEDAWRAREAAHHSRVDALVAGHLARRAEGVKHPVHDFLFTYYSHRPAQLRRWHPGAGVVLATTPVEETATPPVEETATPPVEETATPPVEETATPPVEEVASVTPSVEEAATRSVEEVAQRPSRDQPAVDPAYVAARRPLVRQLHTLLTATAARPAQLGCFGLHEWAMVHRQAPDETRHAWPLRLGAAGTDKVVESHRIACSHFDAFRFFTPAARPLNTLQPGRDDRPDFEQPGCLHATMDLYKHAFRLSPMVPSELVVDCFELAWDVRVLDMRAAPYDFTGLRLDRTGEEWTPVRIETPQGKQEYAAAQRAFAERAAPLRQQLMEWCERLLT